MVHAATIQLDLKYHWENILNDYMGKECNHITVTKKLDPNGQIIDEFSNDKTIYGAISPVGEDVVRESAGIFQSGDLTAYFLSDENVQVGEQTEENVLCYDRIVYQSVRYAVVNKQTTAFDGGVAVIDKFVLRLIPDE